MNKTEQEDRSDNGRSKWEKDERWAEYERLYLETGNSYESMIKAGYSETTAKGKCGEFASRIRPILSKVLQAKGLDYWKYADKLRQLIDAQQLIFNPKTGEPFNSEALSIQLEAIDRIHKILEPAVTKVKIGSQKGKIESSASSAGPTPIVLIHNVARPDRSQQNTKKAIEPISASEENDLAA